MKLINGNHQQEMNCELQQLHPDKKTQLNVSTSSTKNTFCRMTSSELINIAPLPSKFLSMVNPDLQSMVVKRFNSLEKILSNERIPTLALVSQTYGEEIAIEWIYLQIWHFYDSCEQLPGVKEPSTREFANLILSEHPNLSVFEFCYFLAQCRIGRYGQFYGVSGPNQLASMLNHYLNEDRPNAQYDIELEKQRKRREEYLKCIDGYQQYIDQLKKLAINGDKEAARRLKMHDEVS